MTRQEVETLALNEIKKSKYLILELPTGYGKTKLSIDILAKITSTIPKPNILILVAKRAHKQTWLDEFTKWEFNPTNSHIVIECYESFKKYKDSVFDVLIADEVQHLSDARIKILESIQIKHNFIGLSATLRKDLRSYFTYKYKASVIKCSLAEAVKDEVLPEFKVYLLGLNLDNTKYVYEYRNFNGKILKVTQQMYYNKLSTLIEWYKKKYYNTNSQSLKKVWLSMAGKRLKWLSEEKEILVKDILAKFKDYKTLTFCSSISQSERLGKHNITSKNKESINNLINFNNGKIKHITACSILNEGVNLVNCRIGIFCNLNSSEIITKQRSGRLLRHKEPIIIVPYFNTTREEELVTKMIAEYPQQSIVKINSVSEIKL